MRWGMVVPTGEWGDWTVEGVQLRPSGVGTKRIDDLPELEGAYERKLREARVVVVLGRGGAPRMWARRESCLNPRGCRSGYCASTRSGDRCRDDQRRLRSIGLDRST